MHLPLTNFFTVGGLFTFKFPPPLPVGVLTAVEVVEGVAETLCEG